MKVDRLLSVGTFLLLAAVLAMQGYGYWSRPKPPERISDITGPPIELKDRLVRERPEVTKVDDRTVLALRPGGPRNQVGMVEFSDFNCPYCKKFATAIAPEIAKVYPGLVKVFVNNPIKGPESLQLAGLSICLGAQRFWDNYAQMFNKGEGLLCETRIDTSWVDSDIALAKSFGLTTTPAFILGPIEDGRLIPKKKISGAQSADLFISTIKTLGETKP